MYHKMSPQGKSSCRFMRMGLPRGMCLWSYRWKCIFHPFCHQRPLKLGWAENAGRSSTLKSLFCVWPEMCEVSCNQSLNQNFCLVNPFTYLLWILLLNNLLRELPGIPVVRTLLPLPGAWVQSLVGGLRSHKPRPPQPPTSPWKKKAIWQSDTS